NIPYCVTDPNKVMRILITNGTESHTAVHTSDSECRESMWWVTRTLPDQLQNTPIEFRFVTHGGSGDQTYSLFSGTLPTGLTLASDGTLDGATSETGTFEF